MKKCWKCQTQKEESNFYKDKSRHDGLDAICIACTKSRRDNVKAFIVEYLKSHPCPCGESDIRCLEFDHIKDKHKEISRMLSSNWSLDAIKKEMEKCQVLCANCHKRKTHYLANTYRQQVYE